MQEQPSQADRREWGDDEVLHIWREVAARRKRVDPQLHKAGRAAERVCSEQENLKRCRTAPYVSAALAAATAGLALAVGAPEGLGVAGLWAALFVGSARCGRRREDVLADQRAAAFELLSSRLEQVHRSAPRVAVSLPVHLAVPTEGLSGETVDLSETGARVRLVTDLPPPWLVPSARTQLKTWGGQAIDAPADVVWIASSADEADEAEEATVEVGLRFVRADGEEPKLWHSRPELARDVMET